MIGDAIVNHSNRLGAEDLFKRLGCEFGKPLPADKTEQCAGAGSHAVRRQAYLPRPPSRRPEAKLRTHELVDLSDESCSNAAAPACRAAGRAPQKKTEAPRQ